MTQYAYDKPRTRSRLLILNYITAFALSRTFGDGRTSGGLADYAFEGGFGSRKPPIGALVALQSKGMGDKYYLGWLVEFSDNNGWPVYTVESIEDGEVCNWSNVGICWMNHKTVLGHPEWRWDDRQHEFNDRWKRVCYRDRDAYITLPLEARFDGDKVTLGTRTRFGFDDHRPTKVFPNWRKVTKKMMLEFFDWCVADHEANRPKKRA